MKDSCSIVRISRPQDQGQEPDLAGTTAEQRWSMMWQLAKDAWVFRGVNVDESTIQRDVVRVIRGGR
jgi:hypothetical protein